MAYTTQTQSNTRQMPRPAVAQQAKAAPQAEATKTKSLFTTGLFTPKSPTAKSLASVRVNEDVTIPAGSSILIFKSEEGAKTKNGKDKAPYTLSVMPANE